jgi:hypothetical protein
MRGEAVVGCSAFLYMVDTLLMRFFCFFSSALCYIISSMVVDDGGRSSRTISLWSGRTRTRMGGISFDDTTIYDRPYYDHLQYTAMNDL